MNYINNYINPNSDDKIKNKTNQRVQSKMKKEKEQQDT